MHRKEIERVLIAEIVDRGTTDFLIKKHIGPEHFAHHPKLATKLFKEEQDYGFIPTRKSVEEHNKNINLDPSPEDVPEALHKLRKLHAKDKFHDEIMKLGPALKNPESEDSWIRAMEGMTDNFIKIKEDLHRGKDGDGIGGKIDLASLMREGIPKTTHFSEYFLVEGQSHIMFAKEDQGKSWVALTVAVRDAIKKGKKVLYVDFENGSTTIMNRLEVLGCTAAEIATFLDYRYEPDLDLSPECLARYERMLDQNGYSQIVVDSFLGLYENCGMDPNSDKDTEKVGRAYVVPARKRNITFLILDHCNNSDTSREAGSYRKRAFFQVRWMLRCSPFSKEKEGNLTMTLKKDRDNALGVGKDEKVQYRIGGTPFRFERMTTVEKLLFGPSGETDAWKEEDWEEEETKPLFDLKENERLAIERLYFSKASRPKFSDFRGVFAERSKDPSSPSAGRSSASRVINGLMNNLSVITKEDNEYPWIHEKDPHEVLGGSIGSTGFTEVKYDTKPLEPDGNGLTTCIVEGCSNRREPDHDGLCLNHYWSEERESA